MPLIIVFALFGTPVESGWLDDVTKTLDDVRRSVGGAARTKEEVERATGVSEEPQQPQYKRPPPPAPVVNQQNAPRYDLPWVQEIQQRLTALGFNPGPADGAFGGKTGRAIQAFERSRHLAVTGLPTPGVMGVLREQSPAVVTSRPPSVGSTAGQSSGGYSGGTSPINSRSPTQESGGGLVAPPPAGGLIAPAPGGGQIASVASNVRTQPPAGVTPASGNQPVFEPLAPGGISIGMTHSDADLKLNAGGYERTTGVCDFRLRGGEGSIFINIRMGSSHTCQQGFPISYIQYKHKGKGVESAPKDLVSRLNKKIGAEANCRAINDKIALCNWEFPPAAPLVKEISMKYQIGEIFITLVGVSDLAARLASGASDESPLIGDSIDPLEPEGIAIGMAPVQVWPMLKPKGYKQQRRCEFMATQGGGQITFNVLSGDPGLGCPEGKAIRTIKYTAYDVKIANSLLDVVARMNKRMGMEPTRCKGLTEHGASCFWELPPTAPFVSRVYLEASKTDFYLELLAVPDLDARVMPPPLPASTRETPWWERELAAEAKKTSFEFNNQNPQLTPDVRGKIRGEAQTVYDYCKGRDLFASFHDCGCVAQQFLDKRSQEAAEWLARDGEPPLSVREIAGRKVTSLSERAEQEADLQAAIRQRQQKELFAGDVNQNDLISMADKLADACPSKAGAANYAYRQCISSYRRRLQDNVEPFCVCYADRFSKFYMQDSIASIPNITRKGSAALMACSEEISPNPLNYDD